MRTNRVLVFFAVVVTMGTGCGGASRSIAPLIAPSQRLVAVGSPIKFKPSDQLEGAQRLNGHTYVCGRFGGNPGVNVDGVTRIIPNIGDGGVYAISPYFVAGHSVYGYGEAVTMQQQPEGFTFDLNTYAVGGMWNGVPAGVSSDALKIGISTQTSFVPPTGEAVIIRDVKTNTSVQVSADPTLFPMLIALSNTGTGVVWIRIAPGPGRTAYRFQLNGLLDPTPLSGTTDFPVPTPVAMAPDGTLVGYVGTSLDSSSPTCAAMWPAGLTMPVLLTLPGPTQSSMATSITPDHVASGRTDSGAILWPDAVAKPNEVIDLNKSLSRPKGSTVRDIYSLQSKPLSFVARLSEPNGGPVYQVYRAK